MTYCYPSQTYEFTAVKESDLTDGNISVCDTFVMPDCATLNISVTDNDKYLSGDSRWNENANDHYGQQAAITMDGQEIGNGGQIYAEQYFWLRDACGNYYVMIEVEQEGTNEDYFTFYEPYGVPAAGTSLTVICAGNVTSCGWNPKYEDLGSGDVGAPGALSGRYFFDTDGSDTDNGEAGVAGAQVTLTNLDTGEVFTTTTTENGDYSFIGLAAGDYTVTFEEQEGFGFVTADQGGDDTIDSDVDGTGTSFTITIGKGEVVTDIDAGIRPCGQIDGQSQVNDVLIGCDGEDEIRGFSGEDTIEGRGGDDLIEGGRDDDLLIGGDGNDTIDGGQDFDTAVFSGNAADYTITFLTQDGASVSVTGPDGEDLLIDVEQLRFDDQDIVISSLLLSANDDAVALPSTLGSVKIDALANDGAGLAAGTPTIMAVTDGKFGTATIGADGMITYTSTSEATGGFDVISYTIIDSEGRMSTAEIQLGDITGPDATTPGAILLGNAGENFEGTGDEEIIIGGTGNDTIVARGGNDEIDGGDGNDEITGSAGDDVIIGGNGDDDITGSRGNDLLSGGAGNDNITGSGDNDQILGGAGDDTIATNPGDDFVFAGAGDDFVTGNAGSELIFGGGGNDEIRRIGEGADSVYGGDGDDVFVWRNFQADGTRDLIDGQAGVDVLELTVDAADFAAVQAEVDGYLASLPSDANLTNGVDSSYSFTTIALDIANIESIELFV